MHYLAQKLQIGTDSTTTIQGPLQLPGGKEATIGNLISAILPILLTLCSIVLFFIFIWGAYDFMMSSGEPGKVKAARAKITYGILGFVIVVFSYFAVNLISYIFGIGGSFFGR